MFDDVLSEGGMGKIQLDEDLGPDREVEFQTDDEENQAQRHCEHYCDTESDSTPPSRHLSCYSPDGSSPSWPQSYRQSMDMLGTATSPPIEFLKEATVAGITSSIVSVCKKRRSCSSTSASNSSLTEPLISDLSLDAKVLTSTLPVKLSTTSQSKLSIDELPPTRKESSFAQAVLNGTNVLCGIGLLTTPYAVQQGGWLSLLILLLFAVIFCHTGILLKKCLDSSPGLKTYPDVGQAAFGVPGRLVISIILYFELYASCVEYVIMMSDNLSTLFPNSYMNIGGLHLDSRQLFSITATLVVLPTVWLRDLTLLSYLSVGGVGASILVALCLLWVGVVDKIGFHSNGTALDLVNLPVAIGIYGFGFSGHAVFPNIYSSMKEPATFASVLIVSFIFCCFMYTSVAVCGFLMFGDTIKSQYTLNMPTEFVASKIAVWTAVVNPMTKYALTITPVALSLEELLPSVRLRSYSISLLIRTILVTSTLVVALTVPFFGFVMALIGSFLALLVAVIFPCACYLQLHRERSTKLQVTVCIFAIVIGLVNACIGTYSAVSRIAEKL